MLGFVKEKEGSIIPEIVKGEENFVLMLADFVRASDRARERERVGASEREREESKGERERARAREPSQCEHLFFFLPNLRALTIEIWFENFCWESCLSVHS